MLAVLAAAGQQQGHRDVTILRSFPGVGRVVAAPMLAEASQLLAARAYHRLRASGGAAPVTRQSGKQRGVPMRYAWNPRLRNALYYWAFIAARHDPAPRQHYEGLRARGHSQGRALRGVATASSPCSSSCSRRRRCTTRAAGRPSSPPDSASCQQVGNPFLLRAAEAQGSDLVARLSGRTGSRVSVVRGGNPPVPPGGLARGVEPGPRDCGGLGARGISQNPLFGPGRGEYQ